MVFPPTAPWWSAGLPTPQGSMRAFRWTAAGGMQNLGTLPGYDWSYASGVSADGAVVVGGAENAAGHGVPFAGRLLVGCRTSARWAAIGAGAYGVSADGSVVVGRAENAAGFYRAFRWTAAGGMEDLNTTYASLLTNGSVLGARAISPDGRYIVGWGYNAATNRTEAFLLDTGFPRRGDVDRNGCVDDADLLARAVRVWWAWLPQRRPQLGRHIDDADLLRCCSTSGVGVDPPSLGG
jgi:probable HAF family extracellular repeat protein